MKREIRDQDLSQRTSPQMSTPPPTFLKPETSKARATSRNPDTHSSSNVNPEDSIAQFSYGPATQTTVVTTTTTTTTKFPPLMLRAPRDVNELDPKFYPLAASPTPNAIKRLVFEVDGKYATFEEAEDTMDTVHKLNAQDRALADSQGSISTISGHSAGPKDHKAAFLPPSKLSISHIGKNIAKAGVKRSASPVSISEAAKLAAHDGPRKRRMTEQRSTRTSTKRNEQRPRSHYTHLQTLQTSTPITPHAEGDNIRHEHSSQWGAPSPQEIEVSGHASGSPPTSLGTVLDEDMQILSPTSDDGRDILPTFTPPNGLDLSHAGVAADRHVSGTGADALTNINIEESTPSQRSQLQPRPRLQNVNTAAAQDASLPSPSLSPVRAASQFHTRSGHLGERNPAPSSGRRTLSNLGSLRHTTNFEEDSQTPIAHNKEELLLGPSRRNSYNVVPESPSDRSLMRIPKLIDDFESMPEEMKKYVIYQLLRRSSKPVLHFVADAVNPALKCDFLKRLPPELCEAILGHLDVKSLCAAARVSRKWRKQVDLSEKVWKRLFYEDGYCLQEGELARAIREGWGWQTVSNPGDGEKDLSLLVSDTQNTTPSSPAVLQETPTALQRSRRKGKTKARTTVKTPRKKKHQRLADTPEMDEDALLVMSSSTDGPYAAASAAAAAISLPRSDLHLWKSIYMRHHIIRRTWLQEDIAPRHIAFRAHQRHVVTCLQFDSDKILTGSDDANINVYDTQTGALRAKLEGHEGGVWALQYEGNVLVSGSTDRSVRVWDIERGVCTHTFQGHTSTVRCLQILLPTPIGTGLDSRPNLMPKQPLIITGSRDSHLRVWKLPKPGDPDLHQAGPAQDESSECPYYVRTLAGHQHSVRAIAAHADTLVSGSYDCSVRVWKISTGELLHRLTGHTQKVYSVVLDNKRERCISGSMDNVVKVWSLETGASLFNLEGHSSLVGLLDLQQDRLVSAAADSTLRIWDPETGQCKSTLSAHTGAITCFQHDGQKVISGSDRTLKMWNVANGEFAKDLLTDLSGVWQVKFNERRCVAAVQRNNLTFIEVLDFGACRDGVTEEKRGRRILVDIDGRENSDPSVDVELIDVT